MISSLELMEAAFWAFMIAYALCIAAIYTRLKAVSANGSSTTLRPIHKPSLTLLMAFRDEREHLSSWLQHHSALAEKIIIVNDHSEDMSTKELEQLLDSNTRLYHLPGGKSGKKAAIRLGVEQVDTEWLLTCDADTRLDPEWIRALPQRLHNSEQQAYVLMLSPARERKGGFTRSLFDLEYLALQCVGQAAVLFGRPSLCNGAAFLFRKEAYLQSLHRRSDWNTAGGDDLYTLAAIRDEYGAQSIAHFLSAGPAARVHFPESGSRLWQQRVRWASGTPGLYSLSAKMLAAMVLITNALSALAVLIIAITGPNTGLILALLLKFGIDSLLLAYGVLYFRRSDLWPWVLPAVLVYPFYVLSVATASTVYIPSWK